MLLDIELRLRPDARSPAEARKTLEALRVSLDDDVVDDAAPLLSEIVSNSVRHAGLGVTDAIEVRIRGSRSMLHVDVIDPGPGFDLEHTRRPSRDCGGDCGSSIGSRPNGASSAETTPGCGSISHLPFPTLSPRVPEEQPQRGGAQVGEKMDKTKGHVKETVGDLTDDERLEREGKLDQASGDVKGAAEDAKDKIGEGVDAVKDRMRDDG